MWKFVDVGAEKLTKVPFNPKGYKASVNDPSTWSSFDDCFNAFNFGGWNGLGFMFSNSEYAGIDLDDDAGDPVIRERQLKIFHEFDSYSEVSPSGNGLHIIIKGSVLSGRRKSKIEIYSSGRFFTMTGNVFANKPIANRQELLTQLWEQMGGPTITSSFQGEEKQYLSDQQVIVQALNAANGDKFSLLNNGRWKEIYQSQSEADYAYIDIVSFYSKNREQITRMFLASPLGQRDKAKRPKYVYDMITKSFDNMPPNLDFDGFRNALEAKVAAQQQNEAQLQLPMVAPVETHKKHSIPLPPGLIGQIAQFIYAAAPLPVEEYALSGAIGLMAGITGRAYNISSTGLNQYVLMIGGTGTGKEQCSAGISKLINSVKMQVPTAGEFIGPSEISSGPALFKYMGNVNSFVSLLGEFGLRLQQLSNQHANGAEVSLRRMLLDLFNKSGVGDVLYKSVYSDKDKNTPDIQSPAFSIFGESTPERFYSALNEDMISEGLLPRFHIIEYKGDRVKRNKNHANVVPDFGLIDQLAGLCAHCMSINHSQPRKVVNVGISEDALDILDKFDEHATNQINSANKNIVKELWNRAHIKTMKLAALIAVGVNFAAPVVQLDHVNWAINLITNDIDNLTARFDAGEIGQAQYAETKQSLKIKKVIKDFVSLPFDKIKPYSSAENLHYHKIIPYGYMSRRLIADGSFTTDRVGATNAIKRTIQTLVDSDFLREVPKSDMMKFGTTQKAYVVTNLTLLD